MEFFLFLGVAVVAVVGGWLSSNSGDVLSKSLRFVFGARGFVVFFIHWCMYVVLRCVSFP